MHRLIAAKAAKISTLLPSDFAFYLLFPVVRSGVKRRQCLQMSFDDLSDIRGRQTSFVKFENRDEKREFDIHRTDTRLLHLRQDFERFFFRFFIIFKIRLKRSRHALKKQSRTGELSKRF